MTTLPPRPYGISAGPIWIALNLPAGVPDGFDWLFLASAMAFNLLIAGLLLAQSAGRLRLRKTLGVCWLLLAIPLGIVFFHFRLAGHPPWILIALGVVFAYMLVEFVADFVARIDFRLRLATHIPYILLEYAALFSLIAIATALEPGWGWTVGVCFWILIASLIYLYRDSVRAGLRGGRDDG